MIVYSGCVCVCACPPILKTGNPLHRPGERHSKVEGANLFLSDGARVTLENSGVHVFKDASTNKAKGEVE